MRPDQGIVLIAPTAAMRNRSRNKISPSPKMPPQINETHCKQPKKKGAECSETRLSRTSRKYNRTEKNGWMPNEYELIMVQGSHIDVATYHDKIPLPEPTTSTVKTARSRMRQAGVLYKELSTNKDQVVQKTTHPRFKEWWRQYPRKAKKQAALKVWDKLDVETDDELWESISEGTKRYNQYWRANQTAQRYIPHPTTWLRQQQWEDELPTPTPKVSKQTQSLVSASEGFLSRHKEESS